MELSPTGGGNLFSCNEPFIISPSHRPGVVGWCDGAGLTSSAGAAYNLDTVGQGPTALAVGAVGGCLDIFTLLYPLSPLSPSLLGDGSI